MPTVWEATANPLVIIAQSYFEATAGSIGMTHDLHAVRDSGAAQLDERDEGVRGVVSPEVATLSLRVDRFIIAIGSMYAISRDIYGNINGYHTWILWGIFYQKW